MSLTLDFEPHSWYMGFAIQRSDVIAAPGDPSVAWSGYTDNGMTGYVDEIIEYTLKELKQSIRKYRGKK